MPASNSYSRMCRPKVFVTACISMLVSALCVLPAPCLASTPVTLEQLQTTRPVDRSQVKLKEARRYSAMEERAFAWGAQSGLARRSWEISQLLSKYSPQLDRIYRFNQLTMRQDGFVIMPPVIQETTAAFSLREGGKRAATANRIIRIIEKGRIISGTPDWRAYLKREWPTPTMPVSVLFPKTSDEKKMWNGWIAEGWAAGFRMAEDTYRSDLTRLERVFQGIIAFQILLRKRMISPPIIDVSSKPVTGGGDTMRVSEVKISITDSAKLVPIPDDWFAKGFANE